MPFADALTEESIQAAFDAEELSFGDDEDAVYTPAITLWAFLSQVLFKNEQRSCLAAVARVAVLLIALERGPCSDNTAAYCRARAKLSETVLRRLTVEVADGCEGEVDADGLWHGRHVKLIDGTTVSMPDTPDNQQEFPQPAAQAEGLGFPMARLVVLLSLATGMLADTAMGPYAGKETGELALLRQLVGRLSEGDILLGDRYYCSYFTIALMMALGVDIVARLHQCRKLDLRQARRLGKNDHIVEWPRPMKPDWMDQETYDRMPTSMQVRVVNVHVKQKGLRVESFTVATSLMDAEEYPPDDIAQLYGCRWLAELDIRAIKVTMGMDILRCKTPAMVRKEIWTCLLAYNLIRRTLLQSAKLSDQSPRRLSFCAALQAIAASWQVMAVSRDAVTALVVTVELENLANHKVGNRPGRVEPRAVKRRPKEHALLMKPRGEARAELLARRAP